MSNIAKKVGLITQFTCTSSVIFLTHPTVINGLKSFKIEIAGIYTAKNANKKIQESLWQFNDGQNVNNKEMQTLHVKLQVNTDIRAIKRFESYYPFSISDIKGLEGSDLLPEDVGLLTKIDPKNILPILNKDAVKGKVYAVPDGLNDLEKLVPGIKKTEGIPKTAGIRTKPMPSAFGFPVILYTNPNGVPVAERV